MIRRIGSAVVSMVLVLASMVGADVTVVQDGKPKAIVGVPTQPTDFETLALEELQTHLESMAGTRLETVSVDDADQFVRETRQAGKTAIVLGSIAQARVRDTLGAKPKRGSFVLKVGDGTVRIHGPQEGTLYGVLELLEQQGCRWFMPGPLGTVIPKTSNVTVKDQNTHQVPSFASRHFQMPNREWQTRVRCGGDAFRGAHGIKAPPFRRNRKTGEYEPKENGHYYSLIGGKRIGRQHCVSNPALLAYMIDYVKKQRAAGRGPVLPMGPNDGAGFCECENCEALDGGDFDPFSNERSVTDRYIWFFNRILEGVEDEYPDTKLAFYIYHNYMRPPKRWKPDHRIQGAIAPIAVDRNHGFSNPIAPEKSYIKWLFQEWGKLIPELYDRGYWSNLACPGFPFIIIDRLRDEIPVCHELGVIGWRVETFPNYASQFPSNYIAAKLMWDHGADVEALLDDCFDKFFGPAAKPMGDYIRLMDSALANSNHITGSAWDMPHHYPIEIRKKARRLLSEGKRLAGSQGIHADRVKVIAQSFDLVEWFIAMMDARVVNDFEAANAALGKMDAVAEELMAHQPVPMLSAGRFSTYINYMRRFFRHCTEQGYARTTNGNKLLVAANDEWSFQIDPQAVGEDIGLWRADITGGDWQTLRTSSTSWSNQGLRYYKGLAWYRQTLVLPDDFDSQRVFFWCGGVDESAKVWINGKMIGISHGAAMYPFELDATKAVRAGRNEVVVCVSNVRVNELGTGGILAPIILYEPAAGVNAKLENVRDLKPTFP